MRLAQEEKGGTNAKSSERVYRKPFLSGRRFDAAPTASPAVYFPCDGAQRGRFKGHEETGQTERVIEDGR
ncbi:hypothetical protein SH467x_002930 [Pirellulaceae bacterium SH467]